MRARIRDTEIYFDIDGAGLVPVGSSMEERPTAFLIHGGPGADHSGLKARCSALTDRMQLVYFDLRGHGRSARGDHLKYTLSENVEDIEALRQHLGLGAIVSIGVSYGGMLAMAHAARFPDAVSHLVLVGTAAHAGFIARAREIIEDRGTREQITQYQSLLAAEIDTPEKLRHYLDVMGSLYSVRYDSQLARAGMNRSILSVEPFDQAFGQDGYLHTLDLRPELSAIRAPTLILAGRYDWICAPEFSEEIRRLIPCADLRIFEESAHLIQADEPERFLDVIRGFLPYKHL